MKKVFVAVVALLFAVACGSGGNTGNTSDTTVNAAAGNSDGANTIGADTAHMDTTLGKIKK